MRLQFGELNITPRVEERLAELGYTPEELQEAVSEHKSGCDGEPSVYVGTYGKYNEGSLCGLRLDLLGDHDTALSCKAFHIDRQTHSLIMARTMRTSTAYR